MANKLPETPKTRSELGETMEAGADLMYEYFQNSPEKPRLNRETLIEKVGLEVGLSRNRAEFAVRRMEIKYAHTLQRDGYNSGVGNTQ